jgi:hypothetical protein
MGKDNQRITQNKGIISMSKPVCKLVGTDGNVFSLVGKVSAVLRKAGQRQQAKEMQEKILACGSYDQALQILMEYVDVK